VVHASSVTVDAMRGKLLTLADARERLAATEPLATMEFDNSSDVRFRLNDGWAHGAKSRQGNELVDAAVSINGQEVQLTQDALYEAMGIIHLPAGIGSDTPPEYIEPLLNYWFRNGFGEEKRHKLLTVNGVGAAVVRASLKPYSNLELSQRVVDGIAAKYGEGEVLVDYKFTHDLEKTHMRFIVPEYRRDIVNTGTDNDTWSVGIDFRNSLIGKGQTSISGYLFRWWCTNGAQDILNDAGTWSRRGQAGQSDDVYDWAREAVDEVLGGLESSLDLVQEMTSMNIEGHTSTVLDDYYEKYKIKPDLQNVITNAMVDEDNLTLYSVMQAFTQAANTTDMDHAMSARIMRIGGDIMAGANNRCDSCQRGFRH
jgi:hypothetical protein